MRKEVVIGKQQDWGPIETRLGMPTWEGQVAGLKRMTAAMYVMLEKKDDNAIKGIEDLYIQILAYLGNNIRSPMGAEEFRSEVKGTVLESVQYFANLEDRPAVFKKDKGSVKITYNQMPEGFLKPDAVHLVIAANSLDGIKRSVNELRLPGGGFVNDSVGRATRELSQALRSRNERKI